MGLFYKVPEELKLVEGMVLACGQQMAALAGGYGTPGVLEDMLPDTISAMEQARDRLIGEGRGKDLKAFRKHLLGVGGYMDNAPYNQAYRPFVMAHLGQ